MAYSEIGLKDGQGQLLDITADGELVVENTIISQTVSVTDTTGTVELLKEPFIIVPANSYVRLAVKKIQGQ